MRKAELVQTTNSGISFRITANDLSRGRYSATMVFEAEGALKTLAEDIAFDLREISEAIAEEWGFEVTL
jgi:hypothetical protein